MASKLHKNLDQAPKYTRFEMPRASGVAFDDSAIEPKGGDSGAGLIPGVAVITRGEALGHGMWVDSTMLDQVTEAINAGDGVKSRFTHPGLSSDGLGKFMGRSKNAVLDGDVVRADKHLAKSAHMTPDGDLAAYVMQRAQEDPASFGTSIVFERDRQDEQAFQLENGGQWEEDDDGYQFISGFKSPDPDNVNNYPHARLRELRAVDFVDDPAANPGGLFHRGDEIVAEASELAAYALKLPGAKRPKAASFDLDPDRLLGFVTRFLNQNDLELVPKQKEPAMSAATQEKPVDQPATEVKPEAALSAAAEAKQVESPAVKPEEMSTEAAAKPAKPAKTGKDFIDAYGTQGAVWFAEGKTWKEAKELHAQAMAEELAAEKKKNAELTAALNANRGEKEPVSFNGEKSPEEQKQAEVEKRFKNKLSPGIARFAAGIVLPAGQSAIPPKPAQN